MAENSQGGGMHPRDLRARLRRAASIETPAPIEPAYAFVAYAREDEAIASDVVEALRARGIGVRWDKDLRGGERFRQRIGELIDASAAVIVIWTKGSVASDFVIDEAEAGKSQGKLVTCRPPDIADRQIPFGFRQLHCVDVGDADAIVAALAGLGLESSTSA
jgi:hypothetical protein